MGMQVLNKEKINRIFENKKFRNQFMYLESRWMDECMYEDLDDYADALGKTIDEILPGNDITKRLDLQDQPFCLSFVTRYQYASGEIHVSSVRIFIEGDTYQWTCAPLSVLHIDGK